jgi:hypothetical protein
LDYMKKIAGRVGTPIRVTPAAHENAKRLVALASAHGWRVLGVDRADPPTLQAVLEEALKALAQRAQVRP